MRHVYIFNSSEDGFIIIAGALALMLSWCV